MNQKRILFFSYEFPPIFGGASTFALGLARGLSRRGLEVVVLAPRLSKEECIHKPDNFCVLRIPKAKNTALTYIFGIFYLIAAMLKFRPDFIFATDILSQRISAFISFFIRQNLLILAHGSEILINYQERFFLKRWLYTRIYFYVRHIIANSNYTKNLLLKRGVEEGKITVIYPAIDKNRFSQKGDPQRIRNLFQLDGQRVILTVGTLSERKGQDTVISSLPLVLQEIPNLKYFIVGNGQFGAQLKRLTADLGLNDHVIFAGRVSADELIDYYDAADVFVLPNRVVGSFVEGFGFVFLEAASRGKPSIGSDSGGVREAVIHGETGYLVDPLNRAEIAQTITRLLKDRELAGRLGEKAKARALGYFNWDVSCGKLSMLLEQIK